MSTDQTLGQAYGYCWRARVTGRVQGVGYRDFVVRMARSLAIRGWVRNEPDGSVVSVLQHLERSVLAQMVELLKQGPSSAQVQSVVVEEEAGEAPCDEFTIRR